MQKRFFAILQYVIFLGGGIFLVWWSIHKLSGKDYADFIASLKNANYILLLPVFLILLASHVSRAMRWKILMESMDYRPRLSNTFCAVMIGYLANFAFPRLGEVLKCTILGKYENVPAEKLVGTILVERAVDLLSFMIVIIISLLTQASIVGDFCREVFNDYIRSQNTQTALLKLGIFLLVAASFFFVSRFLVNRFKHILFIRKVKNILTGVKEGILSVRHLKHKWKFIFHSVFIWLCYMAGTYIAFFAIKETAQLPILSVFPILTFGTVATIVTPGGVGLYPVFIMEAMKLYAIPESYGTANGCLQWSAQFFLILITGFICLLILPYLNKQKNEISQQHTP